jgi:nucleoside-diphosphate-sugar epimerase
VSARRIAILGATSQLALDFVSEAARDGGGDDLLLFARRVDAAEAKLAARGLAGLHQVEPLEQFSRGSFDAIINFVGVGDPARAAAMGASILGITRYWDDRVLEHLSGAPDTRYVFMSSGAVYGHAFSTPAAVTTLASFPVNALGPGDWYALAKLHAEATHRASEGRTIVDLRIFNYVSRTMDPDARFLISDLIRSIRTGAVFETRREPLSRDYLDPSGLYAILQAALAAPPNTNRPIDAFTLAPIGKTELLERMAVEFGLRFAFAETKGVSSPTGSKPHYHSANTSAAELGYQPLLTSWDGIRNEVGSILSGS